MIDIIKWIIFGVGIYCVGGLIGILIASITDSKKTVKMNEDSYFDGGTAKLALLNLLVFFSSVLTLGIAYPFAISLLMRWEAKHTVINGKRLIFLGSAGQFFKKYILWLFLTVITFGVSSIWLGLSIEKWKVQNTKFENEHDAESVFIGDAGSWFVNRALINLSLLFTLGIATPFAVKRFIRWEAEHTLISGNTFAFSGLGTQLFIKKLLFMFLTLASLGIFAVFYPSEKIKWKYSNLTSETTEKQKKYGKADIYSIFDMAAVIVVIVVVTVVTALIPAYDFAKKVSLPESLGGKPIKEPANKDFDYPKNPEGQAQTEVAFEKIKTEEEKTYKLSEYTCRYDAVESYLEEHYHQRDDLLLKQYSMKVRNRKLNGYVRYEIECNVSGAINENIEIIAYNLETDKISKVNELKYQDIIKAKTVQEVFVIVIVSGITEDTWNSDFQFKYIEAISENKYEELKELEEQENTLVETPETPIEAPELTIDKAKELISVKNSSFLLYHFKKLGMVDEANTYQLYTINNTYETCYAVKGINTVEDLKNYLLKFYTKEYVEQYISQQAGHWRIENGIIYFEPNYAMGENSMDANTATISKISANKYAVSAETEWSGVKTIYVAFEDGDYKLDLFIGPEFTNKDAWNLVYNLYEMENRTHNYFDSLGMLDKDKSFARKVSFMGDGIITLNAHALKDIKNAEELRNYVHNFCTPEYHLAKHGNPSVDAKTATSFMAMWFTEGGTLYVSEQYDYPWIIKEDTLTLTKTEDGYKVTVQEFAAGNADGKAEKELRYTIVYENGKYLVNSWGSGMV